MSAPRAMSTNGDASTAESTRWAGTGTVQTPRPAAKQHRMQPVTTPTTNGGSEPRAQSRRPGIATFSKGEEIFRPGQGAGQVYIVRSGFVRL